MSEPPRRRRRPPAPQERWFDEDEEAEAEPRPRGPARQRNEPASPGGRGRRKSSADDLEDVEARGTGSGSGQPAQGWSPPSRLTWVLFLLLASVLGSFAYLKDSELPWDEDLMPQAGNPPLSDMTAVKRMTAMLTAAHAVRRDGLPTLPVWQWDTPTLSALLEQHGAVLDNYRDLIEEMGQEWLPSSMEWRKEDYGADRGWGAVLLMKQVESAYLARRGQEEAAFLAAIDLAVLGGLLEQLDAWPSLMDRALECHDAASRTLAELLRNTQLDAARLKRLQEVEYKPFAPSRERLREAMKGYYAYERKLLLGPTAEEPPLPPYYVPARSGWVFFKPHATLKLFGESFRELRKEPMHAAYVRGSKLSSRLEHRHATRRAFFDPNWSGTEYYQSRIGFYENLPDRVLLAAFRHDAVMALFAVRRFVVTQARLPKTLEELKGAYLEVLPEDPYTGEAIRYNIEKGCLYSIGEDYRDDGGKPGPVAFEDPTEPTVFIGIGMAKAGS